MRFQLLYPVYGPRPKGESKLWYGPNGKQDAKSALFVIKSISKADLFALALMAFPLERRQHPNLLFWC